MRIFENQIQYWAHMLDEAMNDKSVVENLTIPVNQDDQLEKQLYSKLRKNYVHADRIIRWYRNAKKSGESESRLNFIFVQGLHNLMDVLSVYDIYLKKLLLNKIKTVQVEVNGKTLELDPVTDIDRIRRLEVFMKMVDSMQKAVGEGSVQIDSTVQKYQILNSEKKSIKLIGFNDKVCCWETKGYETTNKFVFQLWQNDGTLGKGTAYGNKLVQSPYCTHSAQHWVRHSRGNSDYKQFWFLVKIPNVQYVIGDLSNPSVAKIFNAMKGTGPKTICAQEDTYGDVCGDNDQPYGEEGYVFLNACKKFKSEFNGYAKECADLYQKCLFVAPGHVDIYGYKLESANNLYVDSAKYQQATRDHDELPPFDGEFDCRDSNLVSLKGAPSKVEGDFWCSHNQLSSLEGAPSKVEGSFGCSHNQLSSLEGAPSKVGESFLCYHNQLTSLVGAPSEIRGDFQCHNNQLTSLKGVPSEIRGNFYCSDNKLTSLEGAPSKVVGSFRCDYNQLSSLENAPSKVGKIFDCSYNQLTSFAVTSLEVGGDFYCSQNQLTSFAGVSLKVGEDFYCIGNQLTSFAGASLEVGGSFRCGHNLLSSLEGVPSKIEGSFNCIANRLSSLVGAPSEVGGDFSCRNNQLTSLEGAPSKIRGNFDCSNNPNLSKKQIYDYIAFLEYPTPEHIDETGHYKP